MTSNFYFNQHFYNAPPDSPPHASQIGALQADIIKQNTEKGIFALSARRAGYLATSLEIANNMKERYQQLVVCGMGGSTLGGKALCGYHFYDFPTIEQKIFFLDNIYHQNLTRTLNSIDFNKTAFLFISKSGETIETICQLLLMADFYKDGLSRNKAENFYFLTEGGEGEARDTVFHKMAHHYGRPVIRHDADIGGRYACFTPVGLIPAAFYGLDIKKYLDGAEKMITAFIDGSDGLVGLGACFLKDGLSNKLSSQVFMPYLSRLSHLNDWYNQLLSESLGKAGKGLTVLKALGTTDQHSVLQLFLEGPRDKLFTFLTTDQQGKGDVMVVPDYLKKKIDYLDQKKLGDVLYANQEATVEGIKKKGFLTRRLELKAGSETALGELMMYFMLETIFLAALLDINPFDQPAVEEGKNRTRHLLGG